MRSEQVGVWSLEFGVSSEQVGVWSELKVESGKFGTGHCFARPCSFGRSGFAVTLSALPLSLHTASGTPSAVLQSLPLVSVYSVSASETGIKSCEKA